MATEDREVLRQRARVLRSEGHSWKQIESMTGVARSTLRGWLKDEPHPRSGAAGANGAATSPPPPPVGEDNAETRQHEHEPRPEPSTPRLPPPPPTTEIDFATIKGYIEGAYQLGGKLAAEAGDPVLGSVIGDHAEAAATAWDHWLRVNPQAQEFLRRMMVGTPLGEVIFVHASLVFSYTVARRAAADMARAAAAAAAEHEPTGP